MLLGDEMGLGKTIQAIAVMVSLKNKGATHFMVVAPASVLTNWCREIAKHSRLTAFSIHGDMKMTAWEEWIRKGGVAVTTYETIRGLRVPENFSFSLLVVDEAHYVKNPEAQRTKNVKALSRYADRLLFMTGTALENKVDEMIMIIGMLQPKIAHEIQRMGTVSSAPQFREAIAPVYYRRKREDVLRELPELIQNEEWCTLLPQEKTVYEQTVLENASYMTVRRVSWNIEDPEQSSKARRMKEIIQEAEEEGRKVLVFSFFLDTLKKVRKMLGDRCLPEIDGSVPVPQRQKIIDAFHAAPAGTVLAAQIQTAGTGLNIQSASVVIICEPQLKPSTENQAISRAYRMGQSRNVLVYRLLCENTIDEKIEKLLEEKQRIFDAFADKSVAAQEDVEVDKKTMSHLIQEEADRIQAERSA